MTRQLPTAIVLLNRARGRLNSERLELYVGPSDPGWGTYLAAMTALLDRGESALVDSRYDQGDLDFDAPISCAQWDHATSYENPSEFRWYRLMASAAGLLDENRPLDDNEHCFLATILDDSSALRDAGDGEAPTDMVAEICRAFRRVLHPWNDPYLFTFLGELLMATSDQRSDDDIESLCNALESAEKECLAEEQYVSPEYLWGVTFFDQLHPVWLRLVATHLPNHPRAAAALKETLLEHGARWTHTSST